MKIELPDKPVDGYEIRYWIIECGIPRETKLRYHVNTKWADMPESVRGPGSDLIDQWQVFRDGSFTGRLDHWLSPTELQGILLYPNASEAGKSVVIYRVQLAVDEMESAILPVADALGNFRTALENFRLVIKNAE